LVLDELHTLNGPEGDALQRIIKACNCPVLALSATIGNATQLRDSMFVTSTSRAIFRTLETTRIANVVALRKSVLPCAFHNKVLKRSAIARFTILTCAASGESQHKEKTNGNRFSLVTGACCIPHYEKRETGGEDAYFMTPKAVGVFDGVGGWASLGINPGLYSSRLAELTQQKVSIK